MASDLDLNHVESRKRTVRGGTRCTGESRGADCFGDKGFLGFSFGNVVHFLRDASCAIIRFTSGVCFYAR